MEVTIKHVQAPEGDTDHERCQVDITTSSGETISVEVWADKYSAPGVDVTHTDADGAPYDLIKAAYETGALIDQAGK